MTAVRHPSGFLPPGRRSLLGSGTNLCKVYDLGGRGDPRTSALPTSFSQVLCLSGPVVELCVGHKSTLAPIGGSPALSSCGGSPQHHTWVPPAPPTTASARLQGGQLRPRIGMEILGQCGSTGLFWKDRVLRSLAVTQVEHLGIAGPELPACNQMPCGARHLPARTLPLSNSCADVAIVIGSRPGLCCSYSGGGALGRVEVPRVGPGVGRAVS